MLFLWQEALSMLLQTVSSKIQLSSLYKNCPVHFCCIEKLYTSVRNILKWSCPCFCFFEGMLLMMKKLGHKLDFNPYYVKMALLLNSCTHFTVCSITCHVSLHIKLPLYECDISVVLLYKYLITHLCIGYFLCCWDGSVKVVSLQSQRNVSDKSSNII